MNSKTLEVGHFSLRGMRNCEDARTALKLSHRELQILQLMAEGKTGREIAANIGVTTSTADTFRRRAYQKLGVSSVGEAVAILSAYLSGCEMTRLNSAA